jgi:hypothetical protein
MPKRRHDDDDDDDHGFVDDGYKKKEKLADVDDDEEYPELRKHYLSMARRGVMLNASDLAQYCRTKGTTCPSRSQLAKLRGLWKITTMHGHSRKPGHYASAMIEKIGNLFVDGGEFRKDLRVANGGKYHLILGVDALSQKMVAYPFRNKTQKSWKRAIRRMVRHGFPVATTIFTDKDSAIRGDEFRKEMKRRFGLNWHILRTRSKAHRAEKGLAYVKRRLAVALSLNKQGDNCWTKHLQSVLDDYNSRYVRRDHRRKSTIRRRDVTKHNQMELIRQLFGVDEPSAMTATASSHNLSQDMRDKLGFRFREGQKVLLRRKTNYSLTDSIFSKPSVKGAYGSRVFTVEKPHLKSYGDKVVVRSYRLHNFPGIFYDSDLADATLFQARQQSKRKRQREEEEEEEEAAPEPVQKRRRRRRRQHEQDQDEPQRGTSTLRRSSRLLHRKTT